jgi:hypothetical protein
MCAFEKTAPNEIVLFTRRYSLLLSVAERVVRAVEITPQWETRR